ncbi:hypothetical protein HBN50_09685 [Halobacteriovorax sp. GB3]|uniref:hypothetical protein n=1 Tax=Halobacteriovorax sp. GB3 TaxID=2719615 RepID=UPI00235F17CF|nr:hypothetical protein [Halobacteriovorax sp. GB3]MDD0853369.1 hypothetical protein [Halobacteriovorax sp. GB3]
MKKALNEWWKIIFTLVLSTSLGVSLYFYEEQAPKSENSKAPLRSIASTNFSFGGSCISQGKWVQEALSQLDEIRGVMEQLQGDENCQSLIKGINVANLENLAPDMKVEGLENNSIDMGVIRDVARYSQSSDALSILFAKAVENSIIKTDIEKSDLRTENLFAGGVSTLNGIIQALPQHEQCLLNHPNAAWSLVNASTKMISAVAGGGDIFTSGINKTVESLVSFLQNKKFSKIYGKINATEFWSSISCILESATENYCAAKDAIEMIEYSKSRPEMIPEFKKDQYNPLEGYFILNREVKIVTDWLQRVQFGVKPRLITDATYKNTVLQNINKLLSDNFNLIAYISDRRINYAKTAQNIKQKRNYLLETIEALVGMTARGWGQDSKQGSVNFYHIVVPEIEMPWYFMGIGTIPEAVAANNEGRFVMAWDKYVIGDGSFENIPAFKDPDRLLEIIERQVEDLTNKAISSGSAYFRERFIVDIRNLVDEAVTSQTISVKDSLIRIKSYLTKFGNKLEKHRGEYYVDPEILPNIADTITKIDAVLEKFRLLTDYSEGKLQLFYDTNKFKTFEAAIRVLGDPKGQLGSTYIDLIDTVYDQFNILLQRESFMMTRLNTFVRYDYSFNIKNKINMTEYQKDLLLVSGNDLLSRLMNDSIGSDPASMLTQLNMAQYINQTNIANIERLFSDYMIRFIRELDLIESGKNNSDINITKKNISDLAKDSYIPSLGLGKFFFNIFYRGDRYEFPILQGDVDKVITREDEYNSIRATKARFCIQSLAFKNKDKYLDYCLDSRLESFDPMLLDEHGSSLTMSYNDMIYQYQKALKKSENYGSKKDLREVNSSHVCAFRNYRRKNQAHWLLKQVNEE